MTRDDEELERAVLRGWQLLMRWLIERNAYPGRWPDTIPDSRTEEQSK